jgi:hypothetical protein
LKYACVIRARPSAASRGPGVRTGIAASAIALATLLGAAARAADHAEAPGTRADPAADIADVYTWHNDGRLVAVVTFDGLKPPAPGQAGTFDPGVLYTVHIDNDGDFVSDIQINTRFARTPQGASLMVVQGLPGTAGFLVGPVERVIRRGSSRVFAGLREDPFFFDLQGFRETVASGTLSFAGTRDFFAGLNITAILLEMDLDAALQGGSTLNIWATTARASSAGN